VTYWFLGLVLALPVPALAQTFLSEVGEAKFTSRVPMHTFTGKSDHLVGQINLADSTVDFYIDLTTLETGLGKRDKDMRTTLETEVYPFAEFYGKLQTPVDLSAETEQDAMVTGEFSIHGVTRTVEIGGRLQIVDGNLHLVAEWQLNLVDYDIVPPSLLIMKVDEIQAVRIEATLTRKQ
jgi:polyisoprenoid-binding protein YceI